MSAHSCCSRMQKALPRQRNPVWPRKHHFARNYHQLKRQQEKHAWSGGNLHSNKLRCCCPDRVKNVRQFRVLSSVVPCRRHPRPVIAGLHQHNCLCSSSSNDQRAPNQNLNVHDKDFYREHLKYGLFRIIKIH